MKKVGKIKKKKFHFALVAVEKVTTAKINEKIHIIYISAAAASSVPTQNARDDNERKK